MGFQYFRYLFYVFCIFLFSLDSFSSESTVIVGDVKTTEVIAEEIEGELDSLDGRILERLSKGVMQKAQEMWTGSASFEELVSGSLSGDADKQADLKFQLMKATEALADKINREEPRCTENAPADVGQVNGYGIFNKWVTICGIYFFEMKQAGKTPDLKVVETLMKDPHTLLPFVVYLADDVHVEMDARVSASTEEELKKTWIEEAGKKPIFVKTPSITSVSEVSASSAANSYDRGSTVAAEVGVKVLDEGSTSDEESRDGGGSSGGISRLTEAALVVGEAAGTDTGSDVSRATIPGDAPVGAIAQTAAASLKTDPRFKTVVGNVKNIFDTCKSKRLQQLNLLTSMAEQMLAISVLSEQVKENPQLIKIAYRSKFKEVCEELDNTLGNINRIRQDDSCSPLKRHEISLEISSKCPKAGEKPRVSFWNAISEEGIEKSVNEANLIKLATVEATIKTVNDRRGRTAGGARGSAKVDGTVSGQPAAPSAAAEGGP